MHKMAFLTFINSTKSNNSIFQVQPTGVDGKV